MLTEEDIQKIIEAQKDIFATKEDLMSLKDEIREDFSDLQTSVDTYAKKADRYFQDPVKITS